MLDGQAGGAVLADKAYDANTLRVAIGAEAVNPVEPIPQDRHPHNADLWGYRHRIERDVNRLKQFSRFATRYEGRTIHFPGFALLAAATIWIA